MNGLTGEELETMSAWLDKLVLYKIFEKRQGSGDKEKEPRYYFSKPFIFHMKQFILWLEDHPDLAKEKDAVVNMAHSLLLYFAANRRLDQALKGKGQEQGQTPTGNMISFTYDELYTEVSPVLDKMNSDEFEELARMAQVVVTHALMQEREDAK
jgi:hypothetical protein